MVPSMYALACLLYARNNINNLTTCNTVHKYPTRNNSNIYIHICKYSVTQNSFQCVSSQLAYSIVCPVILGIFHCKHLGGEFGQHWRLIHYIKQKSFMQLEFRFMPLDFYWRSHTYVEGRCIHVSIYRTTVLPGCPRCLKVLAVSPSNSSWEKSSKQECGMGMALLHLTWFCCLLLVFPCSSSFPIHLKNHFWHSPPIICILNSLLP